MSKIKLAILGACVSRDMFNKNFVADWREDFDVVFISFNPRLLRCQHLQYHIQEN